MTEPTSDACVYVKQTLLAQLESDKHALKWQLSRATKEAETRAAQLHESQAKVQDLLTIVEMNRTVADKAVLRSYTKESTVQQLHRERALLQTRVESQQRRGTEALRRRRMVRQLRTAFGSWVRAVRLARSQQRVLHRLLNSHQRRCVQYAWMKWRQSTRSVRSTAVYPLHHTIDSQIAITSQRRVHSPWSPDSSFADSDASSYSPETASLGFATWKAQWLARQRHHKTASHFARLMLAKRTLTAWKQLVRRRNWRVAMIASAMKQRTARCFSLWAVVATRRRRLRTLVRRIAWRVGHRLISRSFVRLRVNGLRRCLEDWGNVLRDARNAVDEERLLFKREHDRAMQSLHNQTDRMAKQRQREVANRVEAMAYRHRKRSLLRCVSQWRQVVDWQRLKARLAAQYCIGRQPQRLLRSVLQSWRRVARWRRQAAMFQRQHSLRSSRQLVARCFSALRSVTQRVTARKKSLKRILYRQRDRRLRTSLWRWRMAVAVFQVHTNTQVQRNNLALQLEIRDHAWQAEAQRLRRVVAKYQWQCALALGDMRRTQAKRGVLLAWRGRVVLMRQRRARLRCLLRRKKIDTAALALDRWQRVTHRSTVIKSTVVTARGRRQTALTRSVLHAWRVAVHCASLHSAQHRLQSVVLELWRKRIDHRHARSAALRLLLRRRARHEWLKPAFAKWRRLNAVAALVERRRREYHAELVQRLFYRWSRWHSRVIQRRRCQIATVASRWKAEAVRIRLVAAWAGWKTIVLRQRVASRRCAVFSRRTTERTLRRVWMRWREVARLLCLRRVHLYRVVKRQSMRRVLLSWQRWLRCVSAERAAGEGGRLEQRKMVETLQRHQHQRLVRHTFGVWRQRREHLKQQRIEQQRWLYSRRIAEIRGCWTHWRLAVVPHKKMQRWLLRAIITRQRKAMLQHGWSQWQRYSMAMLHKDRHQSASNRHSETRDRAVRIMRRAWTTRDLRGRFTLWLAATQQSLHRKRVLHRVLHRAQQRVVARMWTQWRRRVDAVAVLERMGSMLGRWRLRMAWCAFHTRLQTLHTQSEAVRRLCTVLRKVAERHAWLQWRWRDHKRMIHVRTVAQTEAAASLETFQATVCARHYARTLVQRVFSGWKQRTKHQHSLRTRIVAALMKQDAGSVRRCFLAWATYTADRWRARHLLQRLLLRHTLRCQRWGFAQWRAFSTQAGHSIAMAQTQRQLQQHREALARHVALVLFKTTTRPTLTVVLRGWKAWVDERNRLVEIASQQFDLRRLRLVWGQWRTETHRQRSIAKAVGKLMVKKQRTSVVLAWRRWLAHCQRLKAVKRVVNRLLQSVSRRVLRSAWRCLQQYQEFVVRRQSMMVVASAQQQFAQQRELHRLRTVTTWMQRRHKSKLAECWTTWRSYSSHRHEKRIRNSAIQRRYQRRALRLHLRSWRAIAQARRCQRQRVERWQSTVGKNRLVRRVWGHWQDYVAHRWQAANALYAITVKQAKATMAIAWRVWWSAVVATAREEEAREAVRWRRASTIHQTQVASLENKTEMLLLESVELKRTVLEQKQRCMEAFARRLWTVAVAVDTSAVRGAWRCWIHAVHCRRAIQWLVKRLWLEGLRKGFNKWRRQATEDKLERLRCCLMDRVGAVLQAATGRRRKTIMLWRWRGYVARRRERRQRLAVEACREARALTRLILAHWKTAAGIGVAQRNAAERILCQRNYRLMSQCLHSWLRWKQARAQQREAVVVLHRILHSRHRRRVEAYWLRWRLHVADTSLTMITAELSLSGAEAEELHARHGEAAMVMRVFMAWRMLTRQRVQCQSAIAAQVETSRAREKLRRLWDAWKLAVLEGKLEKVAHQRPMLCIRAPLTTPRRTEKPRSNSAKLCSFGDYMQHRCRLQWRLQLVRRCSYQRLRRAFAMSILMRCLHRHRLHLLRRALWRWFAHGQRISLALQAIDFELLPWQRREVDYASSMLLLVLEEMDLTTQHLRSELLQRAWSAVDAIIVGFRRRAVLRAFAKWRWASSTKRVDARRQTRVARSQAFAIQLHRVFILRAFRTWKMLYIALALREAEIDNAILMSQLTNTRG